MHEETYPAKLIGGPLDGLEVDVCGLSSEIRREYYFSKKIARYALASGTLPISGKYYFIGYVDKKGKDARE